MGGYVVSQLVKAMTKRRIHVQGARVLVMGLTFKKTARICAIPASSTS